MQNRAVITITRKNQSLLGLRQLLTAMGLITLIWVTSSGHCADITQAVPHKVNASGTFFHSGEGFIYAPDVQPVQALAKMLTNGTLGALQSLIVTAFVIKLSAALPHATLSAAVQFLWQYRFVAYYWEYYRNIVQGGWNYQYFRIGRMPVYLSSAELDRNLLIHWYYPLIDQQPVQLMIVPMPGVEKGETGSSVEQAVSKLINELSRLNLLRLVISISEDNLFLSAQNQKGKWHFRTVPRPPMPLLAEAERYWSHQRQLSEANSLLVPDTLNYVLDALNCREKMRQGWATQAVKIAETSSATLYRLARNSHNLCDYLVVSDTSNRWTGFAGYQHLVTGATCVSEGASSLELLGKYHNDFEYQLIQNARNSILPSWATTLFFRALEESLAAGTRYAVTSTHAWQQLAAPIEKTNSQESSVFASESNKYSSWLGNTLGTIREEGSRCLSMLLPTEQNKNMASISCAWRSSARARY